MASETYIDYDLSIINYLSRLDSREVERLITSCWGYLLSFLKSVCTFVLTLVISVVGNGKTSIYNLVLFAAALAVNKVEIYAASVVLNMEQSQELLFPWLCGYICGCIACTYVCLYTYAQPFRKYNIRFRLNQWIIIVEERSWIVSGREDKMIKVLEIGIACFFVLWLVLGIVWFCVGQSSFSDSLELDRLCVVFIAFDCVRNISLLLYCSHFFSSMVAKFRPSDSCCICLEKHGGEIRRLECSHVFHLECLDKGLRTTPTCPICRSLVRDRCNYSSTKTVYHRIFL